jgi:hypothetical protein
MPEAAAGFMIEMGFVSDSVTKPISIMVEERARLVWEHQRRRIAMPEDEILSQVDELVAEEHGLRARAAGNGLNDDERGRLRSLEEQLDQCWDLLRQRRARTDAGEDPGEAAVRPASEVEGYLQ